MECLPKCVFFAHSLPLENFGGEEEGDQEKEALYCYNGIKIKNALSNNIHFCFVDVILEIP